MLGVPAGIAGSVAFKGQPRYSVQYSCFPFAASEPSCFFTKSRRNTISRSFFLKLEEECLHIVWKGALPNAKKPPSLSDGLQKQQDEGVADTIRMEPFVPQSMSPSIYT